ncbi:MAG: DUF4040 domain-containing protein [Oscillospiraceae bacterium]|nr:DUF4040 domain-containing protein [Oscillospiraceae bacterium]MBQ2742128.1 DUF4040 domain-containing protein [Oscillospiraceae bacterium]MBQ3224729.1 DUF4040 domain-containing protein [Oscillospiraceae bacterium]
MDLVFILNALVLVGVLVSAAYAVFSKKVLSSVIALGVTGAFMALEFILLHAPDVAIAEAAVGAVLATTIFVIAVKKTTSKGDEEK